MLGIDGLYVCGFGDGDDDTHYEIKVHDESKLFHLIPMCIECGCDTPMIRFGKRYRKFQDLPMHGKKVTILYRFQRYRCGGCGNVETSSIHPEMDEKRGVTLRLIKHVMDNSHKRTFTSLAEELDVHEKTIRNIVGDFHNKHAQLPALDAPRVLGIDEAHLIREMRCVIIDIETAKFYDILETRSQTRVTDFLMKMPNRQNVEVVCMDMHRPYLRSVHSALKQAVPVIDKFHVLRYATDGMEEIRKHARTLPGEIRKTLKRERFVLLKRAHKLNPFQQMNVEVWSSNFPELGEAYRAKEEFFDIYESADRYEAEDRYCEWLSKLSPAIESAFKPLTTAVGNWHKEIFNYFDHRYTNATTEALNGLIKIANRNGRGYGFDTLRNKILSRDYPSLTTWKPDLEEDLFSEEKTSLSE